MPTKPGRSAAGQLGSSLGPAAQGLSRCAEAPRGEPALGPGAQGGRTRRS